MNTREVRAAVVRALKKVVKLRPEWEVEQLEFDLPLVELDIDSLDVLELCMEIENDTGIEFDPAELTDLASISDLIEFVAAKGASSASSFPRTNRGDTAPLSFVQEAIWSYASQGASYALCMHELIEGPLNVAILERSIDDVVHNHDIMRTSFRVVDGQLKQQVDPNIATRLTTFDVSDDNDAVQAAERLILAQPVSNPLERAGLPVNFALIKLSDRQHVLVRNAHHLLWDHWSTKLFLDDLVERYEERVSGEADGRRVAEPAQYADYATWQRTTFQPGGIARRDIVAWWADHFRGLPPLPDLPFAHPSPPKGVAPEQGHIRLPLKAALLERLKMLETRFSITIERVFHTALAVVLSWEIGREDVVLGHYVNNRRHPDLRRSIGDFSNTVAIRVTVDPDSTFADLASDLRDTTRDVEARGEIPYDMLARDVATLGVDMPEIRVIFTTALSTKLKSRTFGDLTIEPFHITKRTTMPWGISFTLRTRDGAPLWGADFDACRYDPARIASVIDQVLALVELACDGPHRTAGELRAACA